MKIFLTDISSIKWDDKTIENHKTFLSDFEKERLDKTTSFKVKIQFLAGRVLIKKSLAEILNCRAQDVVLKANEAGRLELEFPVSDLSFNLSHSNNLIALAISKEQVGIDIEFLKKRNFLEIAESFFTKDEFKSLKAMEDGKERQKLFYKFWTCKEALIKCKGEQIFNHSSLESDKNYHLDTQEVDGGYVMSIAMKK